MIINRITMESFMIAMIIVAFPPAVIRIGFVEVLEGGAGAGQ
jgi:hypothetical protein